MDLTWFWLVFASMALMAFANVVDRAGLGTVFKNPFAFGVLASFVNMLCSLVLLIVFPFQGTLADAALIFAASLMLGVTSLFWWLALSQGEATRLVPFHSIFPLFTTAFAILLLGEKLSALQAAGIVIAVTGAVIITLKDVRGLRFEKGVWAMLAASATWGLFEVLQKGVLAKGASVWNYWGIAGIAFFFVVSFTLLSKKVRSEVASALKTPRKAAVPALNELVYFTALVLLGFALAQAPASIVSGSETIKLALFFVFAAVATRFFPKRFKEDLAPQTLALKIGATALIALGIYLAAA